MTYPDDTQGERIVASIDAADTLAERLHEPSIASLAPADAGARWFVNPRVALPYARPARGPLPASLPAA